MPVRRPAASELQDLAERLGLHLEENELSEIGALVDGMLGAIDGVEAFPEPERPAVPQREHRVPPHDENRFGAWVRRTSVQEQREGPLAGRGVALKDNIALAGVPMGGGTGFLDDYVPEKDATLVRRLLDAGAEIVGKATCEYLSLSAGSHTSASAEVVRNPRNPEHTTGGSSSGCAALVAAGEVDLAIGGDQGGSIRVPSSFCGIVGMKPTFGLVPYTGILSIDAHLDHTGPMTPSVADNALLLEVIAGPDGIDTRQQNARVGNYVEAAGQTPEGLRVGILAEGFREDIDAGVDEAVRQAAQALASRGVATVSTSVPEHPALGIAMVPLLLVGAFELMQHGGFPGHANLPVPVGLPEAFATWHDHADTMPANVKTMLLAGAVASADGGPRHYAKALRLRAAARATYDRALNDFDALLMPTTPKTAPLLPSPDASPAELYAAGGNGVANTAQFDVSGHPAISVPCGEANGLPVGCMLVGRPFDEATLYRLAAAIEAG